MSCISQPAVDDAGIAVSCPYFNAPPDMYADALESVRAEGVVAYAVGDGVDLPRTERLEELYAHPQVVSVRLPDNMGPYFCHDAVLRASEATFFAVQDADDVTLPGRWERALARHSANPRDAVYTPIIHARSRNCRPIQFGGRHVPHFALYRSQSLRQIGGYYAGFRVGFDTLLGRLMFKLGSVEALKLPTYEVRGSRNSLTRAPETGHGSAERETAVRRSRWIEVSVDAAVRKRGVAAARRIAYDTISSFASRYERDTEMAVDQIRRASS